MRPLLLSVCVLLSFVCLLVSVPATLPNNKNKAVLLKDVQSLVFTKDALTQARRSSPIQQMTCVKGPCQYAPSTALCKNIGFDGIDVNWQCEAELPKGVKLTSAIVSCEGFAHSDDPYVLAGSCGLEYSLEGVPLYTEETRAPVPNPQVPHSWWHHPIQNAKSAAHRAADSIWSATPVGWIWNEWNRPRGMNAHAHPTHYNHPQHGHQDYQVYDQGSMFPSLGSLISIVAVCVLLYAIFKSLFPSANVYNPQRRVSWPLSAIYDMMSSNNVPPPPPYNAANKGFDQGASYPQSSGSSGIWHGLLGGALGYLLGSRRQQPAATYAPVWGSFGSSQIARDSNQYVPPAPRVNHFPQMSENESPSAPVGVTKPGEKMVAPRSVREDEAVTGTEIKTTETSKAYGTTKRR